MIHKEVAPDSWFGFDRTGKADHRLVLADSLERLRPDGRCAELQTRPSRLASIAHFFATFPYSPDEAGSSITASIEAVDVDYQSILSLRPSAELRTSRTPGIHPS
jgi:hypothetical protein